MSKPRRPRVGPRNPCSSSHGFPIGRTSVHVSPGSCRGAKNRRSGRLFHERATNSSSLCDTGPYACKNVRSSKQDMACDLVMKKKAIQDQAIRNRKLRKAR